MTVQYPMWYSKKRTLHYQLMYEYKSKTIKSDILIILYRSI